MKYSRCGKCGTGFLVSRTFCPKCSSQVLQEVEFENGKVIHSVRLIATPEPYPDEYYLVLAEHDGVRFFCRSDESLEADAEITVSDDDSGITCRKA